MQDQNLESDSNILHGSNLCLSKDLTDVNSILGNGNVILDDEVFIKHAFIQSPDKGCELLFRRYHRALCSHAMRFVYSKEVAEDLVSDVFVKFWKKKSYLSVNSSYRFYLFRCVRNQAYSYLRSEFKVFDSLEDSKESESSESSRPDNITIYDETYNRVKEIVEDLPPQCRKVFLMSRFECKKHQEIATEMGISTKTVEAHLTKGINALRIGLKNYLSSF